MRTTSFFAIALLVFLASSHLAPAQQRAPGFVEVREVKVKLDRLAEFESNVRKFVQAHLAGGSNEYWVAAQHVHGEMGVYTFVFLSRNAWSVLDNKPNEMELLTKAFGRSEAESFSKAFLNPLESALICSRVTRPDLSLNIEQNDPRRSTVVLSTNVYVRPGLGLQFEKLVARVNEAHRQLKTGLHTTWSTRATGAGPDYVLDMFVKDFSGLGTVFMGNAIKGAFGEEAYLQFAKELAEVVERFYYRRGALPSRPQSPLAGVCGSQSGILAVEIEVSEVSRITRDLPSLEK